MVATKTDQVPQLTNTQARLIVAFGMQIIPGTTVDVPEEYRDPESKLYYKKHDLVKLGWLEPGKVAMPKIKLGGMSPSKALALIKAETDLAMLAEWAESEEREEIKAAILKRAEEVAK